MWPISPFGCWRIAAAEFSISPPRRCSHSVVLQKRRSISRQVSPPLSLGRALVRYRITAIVPSTLPPRVRLFPISLTRRYLRAWPRLSARLLRHNGRSRLTTRPAGGKTQHSKSQRGQKSRSDRDRQAIWRGLFRRASRIRLWRLPLRWTLDPGVARYRCPFRSQAWHAGAGRWLCERVSGQGFDEGLSWARSLRPRYLALRAYALRAGGRRPLASWHCGKAAVSRSQLRLCDQLE